ncbi:hypothetical protein BDP27DRAFT_297562 [Rhodocollybia butyracea]|uniref:Uncharacterized protein n=1 Tax=Rhodocollybia butyracea TaxID=206335 RepID=A0A9P5PGE0_9AGAR|nr:hypothetical protein BDP27DRAFT_297562 [Rhodocollybia butyracea]
MALLVYNHPRYLSAQLYFPLQRQLIPQVVLLLLMPLSLSLNWLKRKRKIENVIARAPSFTVHCPVLKDYHQTASPPSTKMQHKT